MFWDKDTIAKWNIYRFPLNTKRKQLQKIEEEIAEFDKTMRKEDKLEELADVYIAFAGLSRFSKTGQFVCRLFEQMPDFCVLQDAVSRKMEINNKRVFDKNMHHVDEMEGDPEADEDGGSRGDGIAEPEYITVKKIFRNWHKGKDGKWHVTEEPDEFEVMKNKWERGY